MGVLEEIDNRPPIRFVSVEVDESLAEQLNKGPYDGPQQIKPGTKIPIAYITREDGSISCICCSPGGGFCPHKVLEKVEPSPCIK